MDILEGVFIWNIFLNKLKIMYMKIELREILYFLLSEFQASMQIDNPALYVDLVVLSQIFYSETEMNYFYTKWYQ